MRPAIDNIMVSNITDKSVYPLSPSNLNEGKLSWSAHARVLNPSLVLMFSRLIRQIQSDVPLGESNRGSSQIRDNSVG